MSPHPLFGAFIKAALEQRRVVAERQKKAVGK